MSQRRIQGFWSEQLSIWYQEGKTHSEGWGGGDRGLYWQNTFERLLIIQGKLGFRGKVYNGNLNGRHQHRGCLKPWELMKSLSEKKDKKVKSWSTWDIYRSCKGGIAKRVGMNCPCHGDGNVGVGGAMYHTLWSPLKWGGEVPFGFDKLKVIADLDTQFQWSDRDRRQTAVSSIAE